MYLNSYGSWCWVMLWTVSLHLTLVLWCEQLCAPKLCATHMTKAASCCSALWGCLTMQEHHSQCIDINGSREAHSWVDREPSLSLLWLSSSTRFLEDLTMVKSQLRTVVAIWITIVLFYEALHSFPYFCFLASSPQISYLHRICWAPFKLGFENCVVSRLHEYETLLGSICPSLWWHLTN